MTPGLGALASSGVPEEKANSISNEADTKLAIEALSVKRDRTLLCSYTCLMPETYKDIMITCEECGNRFNTKYTGLATLPRQNEQ